MIELHKRLAMLLGLTGGLALMLVVLASLGSDTLPASAAPSAPQAELRVCSDGCAYTDVQSAIDAATPGDVIQIAAGVYTGTVLRAGLRQMAYITQSLTLRGGYNADFSAWDPALYTTTLDAEGTGRVVYARGTISVTLEGLRLVNGYHSASGAGVYADSATLHVLSSTIEHNRVNPNFNGNFGVGLYIASGSLTMQNSVVQENEPNPGGDYSHDGGGLYAYQSTVEIRDSQFLSNTVAFGTASCGTGGAMRLQDCTALLQGVTFRNNVATACNGGGGGLWTISGSLRLLDSTFEGNTNGGATLYTAGALIAGNVFTGNVGNGLYVSSWTQPVVNITVTHNLVQNNTGYGLLVPVRAISIIVEDNDFIGNGNSGLKLAAKSDTGAATTVIVRDNLFQGNTVSGNGGGAYLTGAVDVLFNRFVDNHAGGKGGGVYQEEYCSDSTSYSCKDNAIAVYDGNLFRGNSAAEGGGLYSIPKYSANLNIAYRNMAFLDNTATSTGSAIYFYRYSSTPVPFEHLTVANNTGGDGAMITHMMGRAFYTNTILYSGTIGIKKQNDYVTLDHVLRYDVLTPTVNATTWGLTDLSPITATPAFAADGYHITAASAAVDAGIEAGVYTDIDGQPRPLGSAPDIGADESPYSLSSGVQVSKIANTPEWKVYYTGINVPPSTYLQQEYLIPYAYYAPSTAPHVTTYAIQDTFPANLELFSVSTPPGLTYDQDGAALSWHSQGPLLPGEWNWVGLTGRSGTIAGGDSIVNTGQMSYTLANGNSATLPFSATTEVPARPVFPPLFITPLDGEMCLAEGNRLSATGLAGAGMVVRLYEDDEFKGETTASATGEFALTWTSALTQSHTAVDLYAISCEPGTGGVCSPPSDHVSIAYPQADWCPQRSYWEGDAFGVHHTFFFRNDVGRYATNDFVLPGIYGFWNTKMHLYSCCEHNDINPFKVIADGVTYKDPSAHDGRWWTFDIGGAHEVTVESQCFGPGGAEGDPKITQGEVLIDPDGFVFDVDAGGSYSVTTGMYAPVQALPGITVTAYVSVPQWGGWIPWPAHLYQNQINPQVTGLEGYFAFFTPPGFYYLQAEGAGGYQSWRSPVVQVINEIVHVNMPLTRWTTDDIAQVALMPDGPSPSLLTIPVNSSVEWISTLGATATAADLAHFNTNPILQPRSGGALDPLTNTLGFDGGLLLPGQAYRRQFTEPGVYTYTDGAGHTATIEVIAEHKIYLPLVLRSQ